MPRRAIRKQLADVSVYVASAVESVAEEVPTRTVVCDEESAAKPSTAHLSDVYRRLVERGERNTALQNITAWLREETHATGAAVALRAGNEVVCVASAGTAPPAGVTIDPSSGISGACLQSGQLTICNDSATDARVNRAAGYYIRSIVASPIKSDGQITGLVEILSATPYAFDRHQQHAVELVAEVVSSDGTRPKLADSRPALLPVSITQSDAASDHVMFTTPETPNAFARSAAAVKKLLAELQERSRKTPRKTKIVAFVAPVLLGGVLLVWSVGTTSAPETDAPQQVVSAVEPAAATPTPQEQAAVLPQSDETTSAKPQTTKPAQNQKKTPAETASSKSEEQAITLRPVQQNLLSTPVKDEQPVLAFATPPSVTKLPLGGATNPVVYSAVPSQRSGGELLHKVTPTYPRTALALRLAGKVELLATVGTNGKVSKVRVLAGEPQFVQAAVEAVSQWRYKPLILDGRPSTQDLPVTVSFKPRAE